MPNIAQKIKRYPNRKDTVNAELFLKNAVTIFRVQEVGEQLSCLSKSNAVGLALRQLSVGQAADLP